MEPQYRRWRRGDLSGVREVTWSTWVDAYGAFIPLDDLRAYYDEHYSLEALGKLFDDPAVTGFVSVVGVRVVGYLKTHHDRGANRYSVSSVYILPEFQGGGLGNRLMMLAEEHARAAGCHELWLGVMTQNRRALEWYTRHGFVFGDEQPFTMGTTTVPHLIGRKPI
jgi:diamine N-acetyltransferase